MRHAFDLAVCYRNLFNFAPGFPHNMEGSIMKSSQTVIPTRPTSVIRTAADFSRWIEKELSVLEAQWTHLAAPCALRSGRRSGGNAARLPKPR